MKIVALSDIHGTLPNPKLFPKCDVVCICGDIVPLDFQNDMVRSVAWFAGEFNVWANKLLCEKVIFVAGNHDFFLQEAAWSNQGPMTPKGVMKRLLPGNQYSDSKLIYLCDNSVVVGNVRFYGTPWIADLQRWAFYKNDKDLAEAYDKIPNNVDVLLTHMPPMIGDCGTVLEYTARNSFSQFGNAKLAATILSKNIKWALCGHVHSGNHVPTTLENGCNVVNVSLKDESYIVKYPLFEFNVKD